MQKNALLLLVFEGPVQENRFGFLDSVTDQDPKCDLLCARYIFLKKMSQFLLS
jgi:hypothetical protein